MPRTRPYHPPVLQHRVTLRNPSDAPAAERDRYGRPVTRNWGEPVWAGRRDRLPQVSLEEGAVVYTQDVIWTVRASVENLMPSGRLDPDVEIVEGENVWRAQGPPVRRAGADYGRREIYYELVTKLRE